MKVAVYLSGHGLGHAARTAEVLRHLPPEVTVEVISPVSGDFLRRETGNRDLILHYRSLDVGLVQKSNRDIDWDRTRRSVEDLLARESQMVATETRFLREGEFGAVYSDMPTLPLVAAQELGLPSVLLTNFTWDAIYGAAPREWAMPAAWLDHLRQQVGLATHCLVPDLHIPIPHPAPTTVGLITRLGKPRRQELLNELGLEGNPPLVLVYLGAWGDSHFDTDQLANSGATYLSFHPLPAPIRTMNPEDWPFHDVLASVDALVAKPGYGVVAGALAHGIPLIHHLREEFAEYRALQQALQYHRNDHILDLEHLEQGNWWPTLSQVLSLPKPTPVSAPGARTVAQWLVRVLSPPG